ncbi:MAG: hypothetical protein PUD98_05295, partial [Bacteroidales bacterium]|nr:hypothetical protein [Bacteroidales bacterium]
AKKEKDRGHAPRFFHHKQGSIMVILKSVDTFAVNLSDVLFISKNSKSLISTSSKLRSEARVS